MFSRSYAALHLGVFVYTWESPCVKFTRVTQVHRPPPETSKVYSVRFFGCLLEQASTDCRQWTTPNVLNPG